MMKLRYLLRMDQRINHFEDVSTLFQSINENLSESFVEVYAPVEYDSPAGRRELFRLLNVPIKETIVSFF